MCASSSVSSLLIPPSISGAAFDIAESAFEKKRLRRGDSSTLSRAGPSINFQPATDLFPLGISYEFQLQLYRDLEAAPRAEF
jgi:hypothetical protein